GEGGGGGGGGGGEGGGGGGGGGRVVVALAAAAAKVAGGLLALALVRPWGRAVPRRWLLAGSAAASVLLVGYGGLNVLVGSLVLGGGIHSRGGGGPAPPPGALGGGGVGVPGVGGFVAPGYRARAAGWTFS